MWLAERRIDAIGAADLFQATAPHTDLFTEQQIAFFDAFVTEKLNDPTADLGRMLQHPSVVTATRELRLAWDEIRALYPALNLATSVAIERRLDQFDVL